MKPQPSDHEKVRIFESYMTKMLKYTARDYYRKMKRQGEREISLSGLTGAELSELAVTDEYFADEHVFNVLGESIGVTDSDLAEALTALPADRRDIVLMKYFFDMTDREIAERLKLARSTVTYRRESTLKELKKLLESEE